MGQSYKYPEQQKSRMQTLRKAQGFFFILQNKRKYIMAVVVLLYDRKSREVKGGAGGFRGRSFAL